MKSGLLFILAGISILALAGNGKRISLTDILDEAELIVWAKPVVTYDVVSETEGKQSYKAPNGLEFEPLEILKGDLTLFLEAKNGMPERQVGKNMDTPMLLFLSRDEQGHWTHYFLSEDGTVSDIEYHVYRRLVLSYMAIRDGLEKEKTHATIDLGLDLLEEKGDFMITGLFLLHEAIDTVALDPWLESPVWERTGKDPNLMTMAQRARLMDFIMRNPEPGIYLLSLAWPMDYGADELLLNRLEQDGNRPDDDVLDIFFLRHPAPIVHALYEKILEVEATLGDFLVKPYVTESEKQWLALRNELHRDIQAQMRCILEK